MIDYEGKFYYIKDDDYKDGDFRIKQGDSAVLIDAFESYRNREGNKLPWEHEKEKRHFHWSNSEDDLYLYPAYVFNKEAAYLGIDKDKDLLKYLESSLIEWTKFNDFEWYAKYKMQIDGKRKMRDD